MQQVLRVLRVQLLQTSGCQVVWQEQVRMQRVARVGQAAAAVQEAVAEQAQHDAQHARLKSGRVALEAMVGQEA